MHWISTTHILRKFVYNNIVLRIFGIRYELVAANELCVRNYVLWFIDAYLLNYQLLFLLFFFVSEDVVVVVVAVDSDRVHFGMWKTIKE